MDVCLESLDSGHISVLVHLRDQRVQNLTVMLSFQDSEISAVAAVVFR